jgi:hypothetical protein
MATTRPGAETRSCGYVEDDRRPSSELLLARLVAKSPREPRRPTLALAAGATGSRVAGPPYAAEVTDARTPAPPPPTARPDDTVAIVAADATDDLPAFCVAPVAPRAPTILQLPVLATRAALARAAASAPAARIDANRFVAPLGRGLGRGDARSRTSSAPL